MMSVSLDEVLVYDSSVCSFIIDGLLTVPQWLSHGRPEKGPCLRPMQVHCGFLQR